MKSYEHVFQKHKELLTTTPMVQPPNWSLSFEIICDASDLAIGAMLGEKRKEFLMLSIMLANFEWCTNQLLNDKKRIVGSGDCFRKKLGVT